MSPTRPTINRNYLYNACARVRGKRLLKKVGHDGLVRVMHNHFLRKLIKNIYFNIRLYIFYIFYILSI